MGVQFQCPSCARELFYERGQESFQVCRHCGGKIIIPSTVIHAQEAQEVVPTERALEDIRAYHLAEIQNVLNTGNKLEAIEMFREAFHTNLQDSSQAVEMLETGKRIPTRALSNVEPVNPQQRGIGGPVQDPEVKQAAAGLIIFAALMIFGVAALVLILASGN